VRLGVKCYTLHTLMVILKEAINAPSASISASAPSLGGLRQGGESMKRCINSHLPCCGECVVHGELPQLGPQFTYSLV